MLFRVALRNIALHRLRTAVVGAIIFFGTALVVTGHAIMDAVQAGMERSIVHSVAGHLQVCSSEGRDDLALFGDMMMGRPDIGRIDDFAALEEALLAVPNVASVVPMGLDTSMLFVGNPLDEKLQSLRAAVRAGDERRTAALLAGVHWMVDQLRRDIANAWEIIDETTVEQRDKDAIARVAEPAFWEGLEADWDASLEFLENRIAPLMSSEDMLALRYIGTDPRDFARAFELFHIVEGEPIPPGQRGILLNKGFYERRIKHRTAHHLDHIKRARDEQGRTLAEDSMLRSWVRQNVDQYRTITMDLDATTEPIVASALREALGTDEADLSKLVQRFMDMDDANFDERYAVFYDRVAPHIQLYSIPIGSTMTISSFTKRGYMVSVNLKVWGLFEFSSLEKSALSGGHNLIDLVTFRELYGFGSPEQDAEIARIQATSGVAEVKREDAEEALFGGDEPVVAVQAPDAGFDEFAGADIAGRRAEARAALAAGYDPAELRRGPVLDAAVFLDDPTKLEETRVAIEAMAEREGLPLKAVTWQQAAGLIGQFMALIQMVLYIAITLIFIVAIVIINNSMVMATMERIKEIGTMRAIGAQRGYVLWMVVLETVVLGLIFGTLGALAGGALVATLHAVGIPATEDILYFLFAGARLYPDLLPGHLAIAFAIVVVVSILSTLYPAGLATRIQPVVAMQTRD